MVSRHHRTPLFLDVRFAFIVGGRFANVFVQLLPAQGAARKRGAFWGATLAPWLGPQRPLPMAWPRRNHRAALDVAWQHLFLISGE